MHGRMVSNIYRKKELEDKNESTTSKKFSGFSGLAKNSLYLGILAIK
jgi:hypothetical protein